MHAVVARGDENVVCFKRMSLRLRGGTKPIRNTSMYDKMPLLCADGGRRRDETGSSPPGRLGLGTLFLSVCHTITHSEILSPTLRDSSKLKFTAVPNMPLPEMD